MDCYLVIKTAQIADICNNMGETQNKKYAKQYIHPVAFHLYQILEQGKLI